MLGVSIALLTALSWAGSSIILKFLTATIDTLSLNMLRLWTGSIILLSFVFLTGRSELFYHIELGPLLLVLVSGVVAIAAGDTIYIKSLSVMEVSRAFSITQCTFLVMTMLVAILFLGEPFTWLNGVGAALVISGVYLLAMPGKGEKTTASAKANAKGVILALAAAVAWTVGAATLKLGVTNMDTYVAAAIRIPVAAVALTGLALSRKPGGETLQLRKYGSRNVALAACAGILAYGVGAVAYVSAMQLIGAGRTVLIIAIAPILILPFSVLILRERLTRQSISGIFTSVAGVCLVVL
jgi:drug/metabolite transporter, DME family